MATTMLEFWASLEMNFIGKTCTLEAETSVSGETWCKVFISVDKKYRFLGVTFSFNEYFDDVYNLSDSNSVFLPE